LNSQSIGWFIACARSSCPGLNYLSIDELLLSADEERRPDIAPVGATTSGIRTAGWPGFRS